MKPMCELKLLPCPFCGGEEICLFVRDGVMRYYWYECAKCYCGTGHEESEDEARAAWNRRAQLENEVFTLEELRQMDGETVFVGESDFWLSGIGTVSVEDGGVFDPDDQDGYWPFDDYGEWLAYRRKPERSEG